MLLACGAGAGMAARFNAPIAGAILAIELPEDSAFLQELQEIGDENNNYQIIGIMTEMEKSKRSWNGEIGLIDKAMLG